MIVFSLIIAAIAFEAAAVIRLKTKVRSLEERLCNFGDLVYGNEKRRIGPEDM